MMSAPKKFYYKGYECNALYQPQRQVWFCTVENVTHPFSFDSSRENLIQGNLEHQVEAYISVCYDKGIEPKHSFMAAAQRDRHTAMGEALRKSHQQREKKLKQKEREFQRSPWRYAVAAILVGIPALGYFMLAMFNRVVPFTMFFPYRADVPSKRLPILTVLVCVICVVVYIAQVISDNKFYDQCDDTLRTSEDFTPYRQMLQDLELEWSEGNTCGVLIQLHFSRDTEREEWYDQLAIRFGEEDPASPWAEAAHWKTLMEDARQIFDQRMLPLTEYLVFRPRQADFWGMYTSVFAHADIFHLVFNLIFFIAFAVTVELLAGPWFVLLCFMIGPVFAAIFFGDQAYVSSMRELGEWIPTSLLGLSGMCSLFMGALLVLMPQVRIKTFFWFIFTFRSFRIPVWFLAAWFISFDLAGLFDPGSSNTAYIVHVVGAFFGAVAAFFYKYLMQKKVRVEALVS